MVERGGDRTSVVIAFGGGIVTDMAGFLAAIFMRGIPVLQIPTTLLAQVDASIGGKTGVNLVCGKNLIGSFHQPLAVLIDPACSTPCRNANTARGCTKSSKPASSANPGCSASWPKRAPRCWPGEPQAVDRIIADSVRMKAEVVSADERESDLRRILNFGHTFGHALEAETGLHPLPARRSGGFRYARRRLAGGAHRPRFGRRQRGDSRSDRALRPHSAARRHPRRESAGSPGARQEDRAGQGAFRAAGAHRRGAGDRGVDQKLVLEAIRFALA